MNDDTPVSCYLNERLEEIATLKRQHSRVPIARKPRWGRSSLHHYLQR